MDPKPLGHILANNEESLLDRQGERQEAETVASSTQLNKTNPAGRTFWFSAKKKKKQQSKDGDHSDPVRSKTSRLDLDGPPLIDGLRLKYLLCFFGLINWDRVPFYLAVLYKCILHLITLNVILQWMRNFWSLNLIDESFRNPIFLFIGFLAIISTSIQIIYNIYLTTFCLYPIQKILRIPKLCFVRKDVLEMIGSNTIRALVFGSIYNALLIGMLCKRDFNEFIEEFNLGQFLLNVLSVTDYSLCVVGVGVVDFYVRTSFGHWLLALKDHLEKQFKYLHSQNNNSDTNTNVNQFNTSTTTIATVAPSGLGKSEMSDNIRIITLDEIQKSLNNMDDQLEIMRSIHSFSLVVTSLNAFLSNGALLLLTYHLLSDEHKYYHGFILLMLSTNYWLAVFSCYFGDSWLYYGLSSLVETIEDEYFIQRDIKQTTSSTSQTETSLTSTAAPINDSNLNRMADDNEIESYDTNMPRQHLYEGLAGSSNIRFEPDTDTNQVSPILRKKHVLFFGEFLHQFENHLATPWTNLTFESHLHIVRAFITLIAAQIIFDHEH